MPTSSQVMVLRHEDGSSTRIIQKGKNSTETISCPVVNFDITETFKVGLGIEKSKEFERHTLQTRKSNCKRTVSSNPSLFSCRGLLLYDNQTGLHFWKDITSNSSPIKTISQNSFSRDDDESHDVLTNVIKIESDAELSESKSAKKYQNKPSLCPIDGVKDESFGRRVELGFRKQSSVKNARKKEQRSLSHIADNSCNRLVNNIIFPTTHIRKTVSFSADNTRIGYRDCNVASPPTCHVVSEEPEPEQQISIVQKLQEEADKDRQHDRAKREKILGLLEYIKEQTNWDHRILPSIFMRREELKPNLLTICFSLPGSTDCTHLEMKKFLQSLIVSEVTCVQFDPVSVRAQNPEVKCRWIVTLSNIEDVRLLIRKGFDVEDIHVIVRLFDDIAKKEYDTFHCIKDIEEERIRVLKHMNRARQRKRLSFILGTCEK